MAETEKESTSGAPDVRVTLLRAEAAGPAEGTALERLSHTIDGVGAARGAEALIARSGSEWPMGQDDYRLAGTLAELVTGHDEATGRGEAAQPVAWAPVTVADDDGRLLVERPGEPTIEVRLIDVDALAGLGMAEADSRLTEADRQAARREAWDASERPMVAERALGVSPYSQLSDPASLQAWFESSARELLSRATEFPAALWGQYRVDAGDDWVSEADFEEVLPTKHLRDLYVLMANGDADGTLDVGEVAAHATDRDWVSSQASAAVGSEGSEVFWTEAYPEDIGADDFARLGDEVADEVRGAALADCIEAGWTEEALRDPEGAGIEVTDAMREAAGRWSDILADMGIPAPGDGAREAPSAREVCGAAEIGSAALAGTQGGLEGRVACHGGR